MNQNAMNDGLRIRIMIAKKMSNTDNINSVAGAFRECDVISNLDWHERGCCFIHSGTVIIIPNKL